MQAHVASLPGPAAVPSYLDGGRRRKVMAGVMDAWGRSILEYIIWTRDPRARLDKD
jgi:hypothetical protein